ncbi:hypothetical protein AB1Y20_022903 [Prymnesium parvum]|uniref:Condensin complex subunit 2 n=1 Tax=Prymnesium parvum TaxID=97485 RepID=A0AB34JDT2_PRYPA
MAVNFVDQADLCDFPLNVAEFRRKRSGRRGGGGVDFNARRIARAARTRMQSPFALDGQDDLRMDLELAEVLERHCSTCVREDDPIYAPLRRPSSAGSDGNNSYDVPRIEQPRPHSTPPTCAGVVADTVANVFRNVLVSIETNEVALGLDRLCVGSSSTSNPHSAHKLRMRPPPAVRKAHASSSVSFRKVTSLRQPTRAAPFLRHRGLADTVWERRPPRIFTPIAIRSPSCMSQSSTSDRESTCSP